MRIISGYLKGKSLDYLKSSVTRPLKDLVKESIFNVLTHSNLFNNLRISDSNVLDLYSGIGSFGLECISRGANKIVFVEQDKNALNVLNKNLLKLSVKNKATIVSEKINCFLQKKLNLDFEIIFLDPPFKDNKFLEVLDNISKKKIFKKNHVIIIHREKKSNDNFGKIINPVLIKNYGRSKIIFGKFSV